MSDLENLEKDIEEIKAQLSRLCQALGIGAVPPIHVSAIKEKAKRKALELQKKRAVK